jgi:Mce-associated membrane protein
MSKHEKGSDPDESTAAELTESAGEEASDMSYRRPETKPESESGTKAETEAEVDSEPDGETDGETVAPQGKTSGIEWARVTAFRILPGLAVLLAAAAVFLWYLNSTHADEATRNEVVKVAKDGAAALLTYQPETVRQQLTEASKRLTAPFHDDYTNLTQTVIPGAEQRHIAAVTTVPAAAAVSVSANHAVVLAFINQTVTVGDQPPTNTPTSVRVTLERLGGKWLISKFETV